MSLTRTGVPHPCKKRILAEEPILRVCRKCGVKKLTDEFPKYNPKWRQQHTVCLECCRLKTAKSYRKHIDERRQRDRDWSHTPEGYYLRLKLNAGYRKTDFQIDRDVFLQWFSVTPRECHYCHTPLVISGDFKHRVSIDRKDNSRGYVIDNIAICCSPCNTMKNNLFTEQEMIEIAEKYIIPKRRAARE